MNFYKSVKMQLSLMIHKFSFKFSFSFVLSYVLFSYVSNLLLYKDVDKFDMYSSSFLFVGNGHAALWGIFETVFPFLTVLPFALSYLDDSNIKINNYIISRMKRKNYYFSKLTACFFGGFIIILIPFCINAVLYKITFMENHNIPIGAYNLTPYYEALSGMDIYTNTNYKGLFLLELYLYSPFLYNLFYIFILSSFSGIMSMFNGTCAFYMKKHKILLFIPTYLLLFLFRALDSYIFVNNDKLSYINLDWMKYVNVNFYFGKNYGVFLIFIIAISLFSLVSVFYMSRKDLI